MVSKVQISKIINNFKTTVNKFNFTTNFRNSSLDISLDNAGELFYEENAGIKQNQPPKSIFSFNKKTVEVPTGKAPQATHSKEYIQHISALEKLVQNNISYEIFYGMKNATEPSNQNYLRKEEPLIFKQSEAKLEVEGDLSIRAVIFEKPKDDIHVFIEEKHEAFPAIEKISPELDFEQTLNSFNEAIHNTDTLFSNSINSLENLKDPESSSKTTKKVSFGNIMYEEPKERIKILENAKEHIQEQVASIDMSKDLELQKLIEELEELESITPSKDKAVKIEKNSDILTSDFDTLLRELNQLDELTLPPTFGSASLNLGGRGEYLRPTKLKLTTSYSENMGEMMLEALD